MINIILNEEEAIEKIMNLKIKDKDTINIDENNKGIGNIISLMIKDYYIKQEKKFYENNDTKEFSIDCQEIKEYIFKMLESRMNNFKRTNWETMVSNRVSRYKDNRNKKTQVSSEESYYYNKHLVKIDKIIITKNELEIISKIDDIKAEKIAFIMLIYAKIISEIQHRDNYWVYTPVTDIYTEAKVGGNSVSKLLVINKLYDKELKIDFDEQTGEEKIINYISRMHNGNITSTRVNFLEPTYNKELKDDDIGLVVEDFDSVIYYYLIWKGQKWKRCERCYKWIRQKNNKMKYCSNCSKIENIEKTLKNRKK